ncbi:hypothetical protein ATK30_0346 [Amycolatopsis echigonensis]|uniref:Uncharacterized protein n=1 Tax=Amycolatopsis echigonensis TaxID=2576905 RepID=A0A2N3X293_9PSEU|nr:hypothetical protein [Amycolatopsis niigatensis]PKW00249.1 hypothetical protein ATK30_0346 [Amycolatopsis niigatensis]
MNTPDRPLTPAQADSLAAVSEPWLSCDECFDQIDGYVDGLFQDERDPAEAMRVHLARCPACCEEAESLISLAAEDQGTDPEQALRAFRRDVGLAAGPPAESQTGIARLFRRRRTPDR